MAQIRLRENLRYIRKCYGNTLKEFSACLGIPMKNYQKYEDSDTIPSIETIIIIADYVNMSIDTLVREDLKDTIEPQKVLQLALKRTRKQ